ncbi:CAP domain-containing protein [Cellulomonas sp. PhB150]|uniref:CAP domain-containing protein n=1 Tax=Cellulomonas sp. PhB150 TaxID=2485188 RepID=UPI000FAB5F8B|nr:CAP domain-containing protein [Cellulomonas sp. PhB150]ROS26193.1 uncharacterized protein YkwD [Cellulomonas sp. PhB150]
MSPAPQHDRAAGPPRATAVLRAFAVIVAVVGVVAAAALAGRGDPSPTVEPPVAEQPSAPATSAAPSSPAPSPSRSSATPTTTPKPSASSRASTTPTATRSSRPSAAPTRAAKTTAKPTTAKAEPKPTRRAASPKPSTKAETAPRSLVDEIVTRTNAERAKAGLPALKVSSCATKQAASRTAVLVAEDRFEHDLLDPIVEACGIGTVGENLALGYPTATAVVAGWMGSAGHKANILGEHYTKIGVGCTKGPKGQLCAQVFLG